VRDAGSRASLASANPSSDAKVSTLLSDTKFQDGRRR
jgi:hypothetical protein